MTLFLEAVAILLAVGALFTLFLWMILCAISETWCGPDRDCLRDRARPWMRDV